jgi:hypothetical protein
MGNQQGRLFIKVTYKHPHRHKFNGNRKLFMRPNNRSMYQHRLYLARITLTPKEHAMNENDLRDCFAMFSMVGFIQKYGKDFTASDVWDMADAVLEARNTDEELGIAALKPKRKYARKEA